MKVNIIKNDGLPLQKKGISFGGNLKITKLSSRNVSAAFDFVKSNLSSRGAKQCIFEFMNYDCLNIPKTNTLFLIAKNKQNKITATAAANIVNQSGIKSPIICCFKQNNELGNKAQDIIVNALTKYAKSNKSELYVPSWCNALDDASKVIYKRHNLDVEI